MLVRTFQAGEMSEALRMVKAEMGLDAMILSSKKERRKGILGYFSKPYFEVTAALEPRPAVRNPYREEPEPPPPPPRELSTKEEFQNSMLGPLAREVRELKQRIETLSKKEAEQARTGKPGAASAEAEQAGAPRTFAKEELDEIKKLLYSAVGTKDAKAPQGPRPVTFPLADPAPSVLDPQPSGKLSGTQQEAQALREHLTRLQVQIQGDDLESDEDELPMAAAPQTMQEMKLRLQKAQQAMVQEPEEEEPAYEDPGYLERIAEELITEDLGPEALRAVLEQLTPAAEDGAELDELRELAIETLTGMVKCSGALRMKKSGPRIMAIVGPTGVGKTTTIAKLAAMHALNRGSSVAMVTTDNFRVGAIEQLKTYAKIMDLPLEVVATAQELAKVLKRHSDKDLILIDTAGRSHKDAERLEELRGFLQCHPGIETYLCMSATTRGRELDEIVGTFGVLPISKFLFTKLDESESFGCIINTHLKHKLPVSYFTTGQKVPEDIEVATSRKLAALVVKESTR